MIPVELQQAIQTSLSDKFNSAPDASGLILNSQFQSGGSINHAFKLETNHGNFFLKWNDANRYPNMFEAETKGLNLLRSANAVDIPEVILNGKTPENSFLILEWIEPGKRQQHFWEDFGEKLSLLHRQTSKAFGLNHTNYIGSLPQRNEEHSSWIEFFISQRLEPQLKLGVDSGKLEHRLIGQSTHLFNKLHVLIPDEKPSLLHGDLWNGNFMVAADGFASLLDPAVYYGHREMDIAMTYLFGGFDNGFYQSYQEHFPMEKNYHSRIDLHNLYPLLVHVNLFGGGYIRQVNSILSGY